MNPKSMVPTVGASVNAMGFYLGHCMRMVVSQESQIIEAPTLHD